MSRKKELKTSIKDEIQKMLGEDAEPSEGRMKLLKLGITYLAVEAKLEESEYGNFFNEEPVKPKKSIELRVNGKPEDGDEQVFTNE